MSKNLYQKMTDIMKEVDTVFKGANISMGNGRSYSAVNHDDVARLLHKPLAENGIWTKVSVEKVELSSREKTNKYGDTSLEYRADVWVEVTFINADKPEEREVCKGFAYAFDSSDKAVGKAESMAVKYIYLKNFTLESTDNEESRDHEQNFKAPPKKNIVQEVEAKAKGPAFPSAAQAAQQAQASKPITTMTHTNNTGVTPAKKTVSFNKPKPTPVQESELEVDL
jgi:hypothetical protein